MNMNRALHMVNHWLKGAPMVEHELMDAVRYIVSEVELEWGPPPQGYDPANDPDESEPNWDADEFARDLGYDQ